MISRRRGGSRLQNRMPLLRRTACLCVASMVLLSLNRAGAILNCFKMNRGPQYGQPGERANWYGPQIMGYPPYAGYGMSPMKMLFQPKLKSSSWFGSSKGAGWNAWRMGPYARPNYASHYPVAQPVQGPAGGYQFSEQLHVAPFSLPSPINPYSSAIQSAAADAGWSVPVNQSPIQQQGAGGYDSGSYSQQPVTKQPLIDPYSIKGATGLLPKLSTTSTTRNVLMAHGAYGALDSYLMGLNNQLRNQSFGYSYPPNWYTSADQQQQQQLYADSPAKIAQQLWKYNLRRQRIQDRQQANISGALISQANELLKGAKFSILDEPRFVGFGSVDELNNNEAKLSCSFGEAIDQTNRPIWVKFLGPYNSSQVVNGRSLPPFNCANSLCRTQEVESTKDFRYKFDNGPATSTLIISDPRLSDYGIYRCSALTKSLNNNPLETIYQIVRFGSL